VTPAAPSRYASIASGRNGRRYRGDDCIGTPGWLFRQVDREFHFTLDACASADNHLCARYWTEADDALLQPWDGVVWCNPPYSTDRIGRFVAKGYEAAQRGATVVLLVPARVDVGWFHDYALRGEVRFVRGRIKFDGQRTTAPFPVCLVIFRPSGEREAAR
jgi:phage N-6-adenine-methyltransferase